MVKVFKKKCLFGNIVKRNCLSEPVKVFEMSRHQCLPETNQLECPHQTHWWSKMTMVMKMILLKRLLIHWIQEFKKGKESPEDALETNVFVVLHWSLSTKLSFGFKDPWTFLSDDVKQ